MTIALLAALAPAPPARAEAIEGFADSAIRAVWQRDDGAVAAGATGRTWLWGPGAFYTDYEPFREAENGAHPVQYFDKGRLEINNASAARTSPWYVSSGLLVKEMLLDVAQTGEHETYWIGPATMPVAGDAGSDSPGYRAFGSLAPPAPDRTGAPITAGLDASGRAAALPLPQRASYGHFEETSHHNWATLFWDFANAPDRPARFDPLRLLGLPITEPAWVRTTIGGPPAVVLVQLFERRTLTYNPANPPASRIEFGNVGRHYFQWRYANRHPTSFDTQYSVSIQVGPPPSRKTTTSVSVQFTNGTGRPLDRAVFRAIWRHWVGVFDLRSVTVRGAPAATRWLMGVNLEVAMSPPLPPGLRVELVLEIAATPRPVSGRSGYDRDRDILSLGDFIPTLVPWQNGGWAYYPYSELGDHGYYDTSRYAVNIRSTGGERLIVGGTGRLTDVVTGRTQYTFDAPNVRDAAYVVSPHFTDPLANDALARRFGGTRVLAYFLPEHRDSAARQLDLVVPAMEWYSATIGAYPFDTYTIAEMGVPLERTDNYAQEYPMSYLVPTSWLRLGTAPGTWTWYTPFHEAGHQWFYSTVGSSQLTDPWLDEALTSFFTTEYVRARFPSFHGAVYADVTRQARAAKAVSSGVFSGFASENEYTATVYDKGVEMLGRVRQAMGDSSFYEALREYYRERTFGRAYPADLTRTLQGHSASDLGPIFSAYLGY